MDERKLKGKEENGERRGRGGRWKERKVCGGREMKSEKKEEVH